MFQYEQQNHGRQGARRHYAIARSTASWQRRTSRTTKSTTIPKSSACRAPSLSSCSERLQTMVQYAYDSTVYYKRSFDAAGVKPSDIKTLDDLAKFPFINKQTERETQHVGSFFGELCSVPEEDRRVHGHLLRLHRRAHGQPLHAGGLRPVAGHRSPSVLAGRHASQRPLRPRPELRPVRRRPPTSSARSVWAHWPSGPAPSPPTV